MNGYARADALRNKPSVIYVVGVADFVKIGISRQLKLRLASFQTSNAHPVELLAAFDEIRNKEEDCHEMWDRLRVGGEWFHRTPEIDYWAWLMSPAPFGVHPDEWDELRDRYPVRRLPIKVKTLECYDVASDDPNAPLYVPDADDGGTPCLHSLEPSPVASPPSRAVA